MSVLCALVAFHSAVSCVRLFHFCSLVWLVAHAAAILFAPIMQCWSTLLEFCPFFSNSSEAILRKAVIIVVSIVDTWPQGAIYRSNMLVCT